MRVLTDWWLTPQRVALHLPTSTAVVADLHLGYDRVRRRLGEAIPVRRLTDQLAPLNQALQQHGMRKLIVAGDLLQTARGSWVQELLEEFVAWLTNQKIELLAVVPGNHDRGLDKKAELPLQPEGVDLGGWRVVHGDGPRPEGRVVHGHEHPWARWSSRLSGACYLIAEDQLVLPAYSTDAAGVNVLGLARWARHRCCVINGEQLLDFGEVGKLPAR